MSEGDFATRKTALNYAPFLAVFDEVVRTSVVLIRKPKYPRAPARRCKNETFRPDCGCRGRRNSYNKQWSSSPNCFGTRGAPLSG